MKFLLDQSADFRLIAHLRQLGHEVSAVSRDYPHGLADEDVLAIARDEKRILLVADRDFGELIFHQALLHTASFSFGCREQTSKPKLNTSLPCWRITRASLPGVNSWS